MENIAHILQECPQHCDVQLLWDTTILQLQEHLLDNDMDLAIIEDSSTRLDAWCHQKPPPSPLTPPANQAQTSPGTILLPQLESQQANYYKQKNLSLQATGAASLHQILLKNAQQQWNHHNWVLHKLQLDWVKDIKLNINVQQQNNWESLPQHPVNSSSYLSSTHLAYHTMNSTKVNSVKAMQQYQCIAKAQVTSAQWLPTPG